MAVTAYETRSGDESAKMYLMPGDQEMPHAGFTVKASRDAPQTHRAKFRVSSTGPVTVRQMIEKHRADAACASCHAKMDSPGLALENFDAIGGWRDFYRLAGQPRKIRVGRGKEAKMVEEPRATNFPTTSDARTS